MSTTCEPLSTLDAMFLYLESPRTPMHAGSIAIFEGETFEGLGGVTLIDAIRGEIERRLDVVPKLRRRVRFPRAGPGGPVWVDDVAFDIAHHVRLVALPRPGTESELLELSAGLLSVPLDRAHPLWELWVVEGLYEGRMALVEKVHHALADGLASVELASVLLDFERHPGPVRAPVSPWVPYPEPREATIVGRDLGRRATGPWRAGMSLLNTLGHPVRSLRTAAELTGAVGTLATPRTLAPRSSINVAVGRGRRVAFVRQSLAPLKDVERQFGVTMNDVLLAAVSGGLAALLRGRGESIVGATLQALVPVGTDAHGDHRLGNKVSALIIRLPVYQADPVGSLLAVSHATRRCKQRRQAVVGDYVLRLLGPWPRSSLAGATRLVHHQRLVNLVITNVPGPPVPMYSMGARMLEAFPIVPLAGNLSLGVAAFSYDGQLSIGILADRDRCPDVEVLAEGIRSSFAELVAAGKDRGGAATDVSEITPHPHAEVGPGCGSSTATDDHPATPRPLVVHLSRARLGADHPSAGGTRSQRPPRQGLPTEGHPSGGPRRVRPG